MDKLVIKVFDELILTFECSLHLSVSGNVCVSERGYVSG